MTKHISGPSDWMLKNAPPAVSTPFGTAMAVEMISIFKATFLDLSDDQVFMYLNSWNEKWGSPFSKAWIKQAASETSPKGRPERKKRPGAEAFACPLFDKQIEG